MNVSDYIMEYLAEKGIKHVFLISGGGCMHLVDAIGKSDKLKYVCNHHEQACAMAAEGYARMSEGVGACIVTTGPGGTNALTGLMGCWTDSIPTIFISGQVAIHQTLAATGLNVRQIGDQEIDIIKVVSPITKYAETVTDPQTIKLHLDAAFHEATTGRPGPVWLDIPLNIQNASINATSLAGQSLRPHNPKPTMHQIDSIVGKLRAAEKPLLIVGNGVRLSGGVEYMRKLVEKTGIPALTGINGNDLLNESYEHYGGRFGVLGQPAGNHILQKSDMIICIGSRLTIKQTGYNHKDFGRNAYKIYVDIDRDELKKESLHPDMAVCSDATEFLKMLLEADVSTGNIENWQQQCKDMFNKQNIVLQKHTDNQEYVSNYVLIDRLSELNDGKIPIITSDGSANVVTMHTMRLKGAQRMFTNTGCASMGYGLPAAIGACFANDEQPVVCLEGDGSLQMNIQELQTLIHYNLPVKLIVMNNDGYLSIKMTQESYLGGRMVATGPSSGVSFPDLQKISNAYGLKYFKISKNDEIDDVLSKVLAYAGPLLCEVMSDPGEIHEPKVVGKPQPDGSIIPGLLDDMLL
jgi:acetolactate synthase I/II/III large subunit